MQHHHEDNNGWVKDAERWICQLKGVRQCKIDLDVRGEITGIHVVASMDREPRHIVRDVEGLLKARLDLSVYYKKIGVVQVLENDAEDSGKAQAESGTAAPRTSSPSEPVAAPEPTPAPAPRQRQTQEPAPIAVPIAAGSREASVLSASPWPLGASDSRPAVLLEEAPLTRVECMGVGLAVAGASLTATVELMRGDTSAKAQESGPNHHGVEIQLLARATITALVDLIDEPASLSVADVREADTAGEKVVVAAIDLVEGRRSERYFGVCSLNQGRQQAAVYAVLDALNRRLELMAFKGADQD